MRDRVATMPLCELFLVEQRIGIVGKCFDILEVEPKTNLMVDIQIAQIGNRQCSALKVAPHLSVEILKRNNKARGIK